MAGGRYYCRITNENVLAGPSQKKRFLLGTCDSIVALKSEERHPSWNSPNHVYMNLPCPTRGLNSFRIVPML